MMYIWPEYQDMGTALAVALSDAGLTCFIQDGVVMVSDLDLARSVAAGVDPLVFERAAAVSRCKAYAGELILSICPDWKQRNMAIVGRQLWTDEQGDLWDRMVTVRHASDEIETEISAMTDWRDVARFDVEASSLWPD